MTPPTRRRVERWLSLALLVGAWASPTPVIGAAMIGLWLALLLRHPVARWRARAAERAASPAADPGTTFIGVDPGGQPVHLADRELAAHALIVGASGAGKSTTLLTLLETRIARGDPVIAIDLKGSPGFAAALGAQAARAGRQLAVFTPDGDRHWNPLAYGNPTALKDKLISTERFTEPHYQRAAERYLQSALQVLDATHPGQAPTLAELGRVMEPRRLAAMLERVPDARLRERVRDYLEGLSRDGVSAIRGVATRLALLSESGAGRWLEPAGPAETIDLRRALHGGDVVLFSLNSSVYGKLAAQLGALAVQDLVSAAGERLDEAGPRAPAVIALDEFSALGADNVLALLARGRESGMSVLLATQELADLERAGPGFRDQVLGITGLKIAHRQDVPASASLFAQMAGTHQVWERTETLRSPFTAPAAVRGSRRQVERFLVHPNEIKSLPTGSAVVLAKLPDTRIVRVRVRAPQAAAVAPAPVAPVVRGAPRGRGAGEALGSPRRASTPAAAPAATPHQPARGGAGPRGRPGRGAPRPDHETTRGDRDGPELGG